MPTIKAERPEIDVLKLLGRHWQALSETIQERLLDECFWYWRSRGFPYDWLGDAEMRKDFVGLSHTDTTTAWEGSAVQGSTAGLRLANFFHPTMWGVRCRDAYAPLDRFECDRSLRRVLRHALTIWPDRFSVNATNLRSMLRTFSKTTRVSNFRPTLAKAVIERFSSPRDQVLDFSAGYGGRLLGCIAAGRHYLGIDPSFDQIQGGIALVNALRRLGVHVPGVHLCQGPAEDALAGFAPASINLVFSSPPYFDRERYSHEPSQSYIRFPTYLQWRERFLTAVLAESARILKRGGRLVLNVSNVDGYPIADDALSIGSGFLRHEATLHLRLARKPYLKISPQGHFKYEPLLVLRKT